MNNSLFSQKIIGLALSVPEGHVTTYGHLARAAGGGGQAARSVSGILARSQEAGAIPFHRIVYAGGKVWCNNNYDAKRKKLYVKEGIIINKNNVIENFEETLYHFD